MFRFTVSTAPLHLHLHDLSKAVFAHHEHKVDFFLHNQAGGQLDSCDLTAFFACLSFESEYARVEPIIIQFVVKASRVSSVQFLIQELCLPPGDKLQVRVCSYDEMYDFADVAVLLDCSWSFKTLNRVNANRVVACCTICDTLPYWLSMQLNDNELLDATTNNPHSAIVHSRYMG